MNFDIGRIINVIEKEIERSKQTPLQQYQDLDPRIQLYCIYNAYFRLSKGCYSFISITDIAEEVKNDELWKTRPDFSVIKILELLQYDEINWEVNTEQSLTAKITEVGVRNYNSLGLYTLEHLNNIYITPPQPEDTLELKEKELKEKEKQLKQREQELKEKEENYKKKVKSFLEQKKEYMREKGRK